MQNNTEQQKITPPTGKRRMSAFWKAVIVTVILPVIIGILTMAGLITSGVMFILFGIFYVSVIVIAIILAVTREREIAAGIFTGLGFGLLAFVTSCFAAAFLGR